MCLSPREAEEIIAARDRSGKVVMVGYMRRFAPAFTEAVQRLPRLGPVTYARVHDIIGHNALIIDQTAHVDRPDDVPQRAIEDRWARGAALVKEALGDVPEELAWTYRLLCGLGSHDLSAMRELLGPPEKVVAARQWRKGGFIVALLDYGDFTVTYETGVDDQVRFDAHIEVYGESGSLRVQYDTPYVRHFPTTLLEERTVGLRAHRAPAAPQGPLHARAGVLPRGGDHRRDAQDVAGGLRRRHGAVRPDCPGDRARPMTHPPIRSSVDSGRRSPSPDPDRRT
jgi:predicted dehydrogenase